MKHSKFSLLPLVVVLFLFTSCAPILVPVTPYPPATLPAQPLVTPLPVEVQAKAAPQTVLVRYKPGTTEESKAKTRASANAKLDQKYAIVPRLEKLKVENVESALRALRKQANVLYAEPDYIVTIDDTPDDPRFPEMWGMVNIKALEAWDTFTGNPDFVVAVIDTGIDYNHPDLAANIWTNPDEIAGNGLDDDGNGYVDDVHGYDFANNDGDPMDDHFHGTHVAGTIGAVGNNGAGVVGVNWQVKLMPLKFLASTGGGSTSAAISALEYAIRNGVKVSNNSWGGGSYSQALYDAIRSSQAMGHLFVAAAGNASTNSDLYPTYPASYDLDNIISVAAITSSDQLASFSNYGSRAVDLGAPGVSILSTALGDGYAIYNGTSMAAPHVTGAAALIYGLHPNWIYSKVRDQILATTWAAPALSGRTVTGGVLNAFEAVSNEDPGPIPTTAPTPIGPTPTPPSPYYSPALAEFPGEGRIRGTFRDTWLDDAVVETITERSTTGSPGTRIERLEHTWQFHAPPDRPEIVFRVIAWVSPPEDNDSMVLEYSTDRANWTPMLVLTRASRSNDYQEYLLPASLAGQNVYVRVTDSDRTVGSWKSADSVYVDQMYIRCAAS